MPEPEPDTLPEMRWAAALVGLTLVAIATASASPCTGDAAILPEFPGGAVDIPAAQETALLDLLYSSGLPKLHELVQTPRVALRSTGHAPASSTTLCCGVPRAEHGTTRSDDTHRWKGEVFVLDEGGGDGAVRRPFHHAGGDRNRDHRFIFCKAATGDIEEVQLEYARLAERSGGLMPSSLVAICIEIDDFCIKNDGLVFILNDGFCI